ncbi:ABC exporter membrane fusion protein [Mastigocoleus sp. MO_188.B34]|uniref:ABC exporter membrane fusion protein n=1 Tax=Mastigocoleus sp. MO_188.B34 TaxID=3036635 RepID=UPI0026165A82|nr:ABC exporter membrane fusion protein [Mastigocoleus sp. MO_188.B34]MDJ0697973.1 ABC exporter membrane fusion protein [Mastigocoleus sp. MO_188.B34]
MDRKLGELINVRGSRRIFNLQENRASKLSKLLMVFALSGWGLLLVSCGIFYRLHIIKQPLIQSSSFLSDQELLIPSRVAALGYLEPKGEITKISAPTFREGATVTQLMVQRGDRVTKGDIIAILNNRDRLQASLQQAKTKVAVAQTNLAKVKAGAKQGDINAQNARFMGTQAELDGQIAIHRASIASLEAQLLGERNTQQATIERLKTELLKNTTDCQRYKTLHQNGAVSDQEYDRVCLQQEIIQKQLQEAQVNLQRIINTLTNKISAAKADLNRTITTLETKMMENKAMLSAISEVRPVDLQLAHSELASAQAAVKQAETNLALAYVRAPKDGQILKVHTWPGEMIDNQGIVELGNTSQMYVTAEVYESDITRVHQGQSVTITSDGVVEELQGTVEEIGLQVQRQKVLGTNPTNNVDARVVEVKIRLNSEDSQRVAHLTNLQVNAIIDSSENQ